MVHALYLLRLVLVTPLCAFMPDALLGLANPKHTSALVAWLHKLWHRPYHSCLACLHCFVVFVYLLDDLVCIEFSITPPMMTSSTHPHHRHGTSFASATLCMTASRLARLLCGPQLSLACYFQPRLLFALMLDYLNIRTNGYHLTWETSFTSTLAITSAMHRPLWLHEMLAC